MPIRVKTVGTSLCIVFSVKDLKQVLIVIFITSNIFFLVWFGFTWNLQVSSFCYCYKQIEVIDIMLKSRKHIIYLTPFDHCAVTWCLLVVWRTSFGKKGQFQGQLWRSEEEVAVRQMHIFALIIKLHFCTLFGTGHWAVSTTLQILSPQPLQKFPVSHLESCKMHFILIDISKFSRALDLESVNLVEQLWECHQFQIPYSREQKHVSVSDTSCY
jgi:hypothetical protein